MHKFGEPQLKGQPRPKKWPDFEKIYVQKKHYLYNIKQMTLAYSKTGPGNTGGRHFGWEILPALAFWNPEVTFIQKKYFNNGPPTISITYVDDQEKVMQFPNTRA